MKRWGESLGLATLTLRGGSRVIERDTTQCPHCERVIRLAPDGNPVDQVAWCDRCGKFVCATAACTACTPFNRRLEEYISRRYHREQFARIAGLEG